MANPSFFDNQFMQAGDCCQIASCAFVLSYYSMKQVGKPIAVGSVVLDYLDYLINNTVGTTTPVLQTVNAEATSLRSNFTIGNASDETKVRDLFLEYCENAGNISGSEHFADFVSSINPNVCGIKGTDINDLESWLSADPHNLAMILFEGQEHWAVVGKDGQKQIYRDPRNNTYSDFPLYHNGENISQLNITEFIKFRG